MKPLKLSEVDFMLPTLIDFNLFSSIKTSPKIEIILHDNWVSISTDNQTHLIPLSNIKVMIK